MEVFGSPSCPIGSFPINVYYLGFIAEYCCFQILFRLNHLCDAILREIDDFMSYEH